MRIFPATLTEQDCSLCFCPFYPCQDERTGGREKDGSWCCVDCLIVHRPERRRMIMDELMKGQSVPQAWKALEELL